MYKIKNLLYTLLLLMSILAYTLPAQAVELTNPLGGDPSDKDPRLILGDIIGGALGLIGSIALLMFIYGGVMFILSMGNAEKIGKARDTMVWSAVGIAIIFSSYALVGFIIDFITK